MLTLQSNQKLTEMGLILDPTTLPRVNLTSTFVMILFKVLLQYFTKSIQASIQQFQKVQNV